MRVLSQSMHDQVADTLRQEIFSGSLAPGAFVDEVALSAQLEISRTPLREALKVLAAEGLVRHEPRRGCFVSEVTERDLDEIFPVIALLEGRCAHEAALHASDADLQALELLHERLKKAARQQRVVEIVARQNRDRPLGGKAAIEEGLTDASHGVERLGIGELAPVAILAFTRRQERARGRDARPVAAARRDRSR